MTAGRGGLRMDLKPGEAVFVYDVRGKRMRIVYEAGALRFLGRRSAFQVVRADGRRLYDGELGYGAK